MNASRTFGILIGFVLVVFLGWVLGLYQRPSYLDFDFEKVHNEIEIMCLNIEILEESPQEHERLVVLKEELQRLVKNFNENAAKKTQWDYKFPKEVSACI